jgi:hypothetical protein
VVKHILFCKTTISRISQSTLSFLFSQYGHVQSINGDDNNGVDDCDIGSKPKDGGDGGGISVGTGDNLDNIDDRYCESNRDRGSDCDHDGGD